MSNSDITVERLREVLHYNPSSGIFTWLIKVNPRGIHGLPGTRAGKRPNDSGYLRIGIDGSIYRAHRLAWMYMTGRWPSILIDHKNGNPSDNRWQNLREATYAENSQNQRTARSNSKSGFLGAIPHGVKWRARIKVDGKNVDLGCFDTPELAHEAYILAKRRLHPASMI